MLRKHVKRKGIDFLYLFSGERISLLEIGDAQLLTEVQVDYRLTKFFFGHFTLTPSPIALKVPVYRTPEV